MSNTERELVDIDGEIVAETEKAYRLKAADRIEWLPKSQCQWDAGAKQMSMPTWLAKDKGLV